MILFAQPESFIYSFNSSNNSIPADIGFIQLFFLETDHKSHKIKHESCDDHTK